MMRIHMNWYAFGLVQHKPKIVGLQPFKGKKGTVELLMYLSVIMKMIVYWQKLLAVRYPAAEELLKMLISETEPSA